MSEEVKIEESSGNVFQDLGFSKKEAEQEQLRVDLAIKIYRLFEELKLTPAKAKADFGINPSDVSQIQNGDFSFTMDKLFTILSQLNCNVEIRITPSEDTQGHLRLVTTVTKASNSAAAIHRSFPF